MQHSAVGFPSIGIPKGSTPVLIRTHSGPGDYTLIDDDFFGSRYIRMNSASAQNVIIPTGLTLLQPVTIIQSGAGICYIDPDVGVSVQSVDGWLTFRTRYSSVTLIPVGTDSYDLIGDLAG